MKIADKDLKLMANSANDALRSLSRELLILRATTEKYIEAFEKLNKRLHEIREGDDKGPVV